MKRAIPLFAAAMVAACSQTPPSRAAVKEIADAEMSHHCASNSANCEALSFKEMSANNGLWLVEYESTQFRYVVIVDDVGSAEITLEER